MAKLPIGIGKAKFDREMEEWVFQDQKPFWKDFTCDAERLAPPQPPKTRAQRDQDERDEIAMIERATADIAGRLEKTIAARSPADDAEHKRRLEEASRQAMGDAKSDKERKQIEVGLDMMSRLTGAKNLEAMLAEMNRAMADPALDDMFYDEEERDEAGPSSEGWFEVSLLEGRKMGIDPAQRKAYEDYATNHAAIGTAVVEAVFAYYQKCRKGYAEAFGEASAPVISTPADLRFLMEHQSVLVRPPSKDGKWAGCEIGLTFACEWDDEHGLGVRLRGTTVVEVGPADVAHGDEGADDEGDDDDE